MLLPASLCKVVAADYFLTSSGTSIMYGHGCGAVLLLLFLTMMIFDIAASCSGSGAVVECALPRGRGGVTG